MLWRSFESSRSRLGGFKPILTQELQELFKRLYQVLREGDNAAAADLAPIFHRIIISTTRQSLSSGRQVDSAAEQSILLSLLMPGDDEWKTALSTTQIFARWQRLIFSGSALDGDREGGDYELADNKDNTDGDNTSDTSQVDDQAEATEEDEFPEPLGEDFEVEADEADDAVGLTPFAQEEEEEELDASAFELPALYAPVDPVEDAAPKPTAMTDMRLR